MKILSIECSATPASVAIIENGKVLANSFVNVKLTHSQTVMPMIGSALMSSKTDIGEIDGISVAAGPGSFTGIRIGISILKGLAAPKNLPCVAVSTLRAMAEAFKGQDITVCAVMDARCNQVYNALFEVNGSTVTRLCEDRAIMCDELKEELSKTDKKIVVCGDGSNIFYEYVKDFKNITLAPEHLKFQNAVGVGLCSEEDFKNKKTVTAEELLPIYLRLPQAERELKLKKEKEQ